MTITRRLRTFFLGFVAAGVIAACGGGSGGSWGGAALSPAIVSQPAPASVADGATATFSVTASGEAPLTYQWRRNGADLVDGAAVAGATGVTLSLGAPYAFNASQITVVVSNAAGNAVSNNALLTVTPVAPAITVQPANATVSVGAPAGFAVGISGGTTPVSYQWKRNGAAIAGATAASYSLAATATGDDGARFAVDVINPAGTLSSAAAMLSVAALGKSWGPAVLVSSGDALHAPADPRVTIDAAGNAISVWQEAVGLSVRNAVWASRYVAGNGWSPAATIDDPVGNSAAPQLAMAPGGVAVATFVQSTSNNGGGVRMIANRFDGATWGAPGRVDVLDAAIDVDHRVAIAPAGAATLAFNQSDNVTGRRATASRSSTAGVWATPDVVGAASSYEPQVAVAANGDAVMVWLVSDTASTRSLWASRNLGAGWSAPVSIVTGAKEMAFLHLRADAAGDAIAVWQERPATRCVVRATRLDAASGVWSAPVSVNDGTRHAHEPELAMGSTGDTLVVWYEASDGAQANGIVDHGVVASRYTASTAAWSGAARVQPVGASAGVLPKVALDGAGNAIAVWLQGAPGNAARQEVWASNFDAAGALWAAPMKLMTDPDAYAMRSISQAPEISVNANGDAVVVWFQRTDVPFALGIWTRVYR